MNNDLKHLTNRRDAVFHWINYGKNENRICTINELNDNIFDFDLYILMNNDLKHLTNRRDAVFHWLRHGKYENRIYNIKKYEIDYNLAYNFNIYYLLNLNIDNLNFADLIKNNTPINKEFFIKKFLDNFYDIFLNISDIKLNKYILDKIKCDNYIEHDIFINKLKNIIDNLSEKNLYVYYNINFNEDSNSNFKYLLNNIENLNNEKIIILYKNFLKYNIDNLDDNELKIIYILNNITKEYIIPTINKSVNNSIKIDFNKIYKNNENFITFIIPTIGRQSLLNTIKSLQNLLNPNWKAVIIFDGIKNNFKIDDIRITILEHEKKGRMNEISGNAGLVRNIGLNYINNSKYIAFLDDDDYIHPNYINYLKEEISINKDIDVCIFRMIDKNNLILPRKIDNKIIKTKVGISFAININIAKKFQFTNSNFEDYLFLKKVELYGGKIVISKYVSYYVRIEPFTVYEEFPRIVIENNS